MWCLITIGSWGDPDGSVLMTTPRNENKTFVCFDLVFSCLSLNKSNGSLIMLIGAVVFKRYLIKSEFINCNMTGYIITASI